MGFFRHEKDGDLPIDLELWGRRALGADGAGGRQWLPALTARWARLSSMPSGQQAWAPELGAASWPLLLGLPGWSRPSPTLLHPQGNTPFLMDIPGLLGVGGLLLLEHGGSQTV